MELSSLQIVKPLSSIRPFPSTQLVNSGWLKAKCIGGSFTHRSVFTNFPSAQKTQVYLVNQDNAPQSQILIGYRTIPYDFDGDFFKATVVIVK